MHPHLPSLMSPFIILLQLCGNLQGLPIEDNTSAQVDNNDTLPWKNDISSTPTFSPYRIDNEAFVPQAYDITRSKKSSHERIQYITEHIDYDEDDDYDEDHEVITPPTRFSGEACPYDRCRHLQPPCEEIQKMAGGKCLCPGISGSSVLPDSPRLKQVIPGQSGIGVSWCSPLSTVRSYKVVYGPPEGPMEIGPLLNQSYRSFSITDLLPGTSYKVCVVAVNDAGESQVDGEEELNQEDHVGPCDIVHTLQGSYIYWAIGIGLAVFVILLGISGLVYWFWSKKKVRRIKRSRPGDMGVTNMSFKAESIENL